MESLRTPWTMSETQLHPRWPFGAVFLSAGLMPYPHPCSISGFSDACVCGLFYDPRKLLLPILAIPSLQEQWLSRHINGRLSDFKPWCFPDPAWQTIAVTFRINCKASPPWNAALSIRDTMLEIPHIPSGNAKDRILFHVGSHLYGSAIG